MTQDQINSLLRSLGASLGGAIAAWMVHKGYVGQADTQVVIEAITGLLLSVGAMAWSLMARRQSALVATVSAMPEVGKIIAAPTMAGDALAEKVGSTPAAQVVKASNA